MRKGSPVYKCVGCCRLTWRICLVKNVRNCMAHTARKRQETREREEYIHAETTFVFIYVSEFLSPRFYGFWEKTSRRSRATVQCPPSDRHAQSRFHFIEIAVWLLCPRTTSVGSMYPSIRPIRLLSRFSGTKRSVALFISVVFRITMTRFSSYPSPIKHIRELT